MMMISVEFTKKYELIRDKRLTDSSCLVYNYTEVVKMFSTKEEV